MFLTRRDELKYSVGNHHFKSALGQRFRRRTFFGPGYDCYNESTDLKDVIKSVDPDVIFFILPGRDLDGGTYLTDFDYGRFEEPLKILYDTDAQRCVGSRCEFVNRNRVDHLLLGNNYRYNRDHEDLIRVPCRVVWQPFGVDTGFFSDHRRSRPKDILFLGNTRWSVYPAREHMANTMRRKFRKRFFSSPGHRINLLDYVALLNRYKMFVNAMDISNAFLMKNLEAMSCGCLLVSQRNPCFGRLGFVHGTHLLLWETFRELVDLAEYYLEHDEERRRIASEGREFVIRNHTWDHRIDDLLDEVGSRMDWVCEEA